jgi:hypothetical protein
MWDVLFVVLFGTGDNFYTGTPNHLNGELANKTIQVCHSSLPYISSFSQQKTTTTAQQQQQKLATQETRTCDGQSRRSLKRRYKKKNKANIPNHGPSTL